MTEDGSNRQDGEDDAALTAFLDGEARDAERARMAARLEREPALRARLDELGGADRLARAAFDALLAEAPLTRMRGRLDQALRVPPARPASLWRGRAVAAAAAIGLFVAGALVGQSRTPIAEEDWRHSVAEYMELYAPDTFRPTETAVLRRDVEFAGERLGLKLDPEKLQVAGLSLQRVEMLRYDGAALGQLGYLDGETPLAFCVIRDGEADAPLSQSQRGGFQTASWAKAGRGYMVIGALPAGSTRRGRGRVDAEILIVSGAARSPASPAGATFPRAVDRCGRAGR